MLDHLAGFVLECERVTYVLCEAFCASRYRFWNKQISCNVQAVELSLTNVNVGIFAVITRYVSGRRMNGSRADLCFYTMSLTDGAKDANTVNMMSTHVLQ